METLIRLTLLDRACDRNGEVPLPPSQEPLKPSILYIFSVSSSFEFVIKSNTIAISFGFDCVNCYRAYFLYQYWQDIFKSALNQIGTFTQSDGRLI